MHVYPSKDYITRGRQSIEFSPEAIKKFVDHLSPDKVLILLEDGGLEEKDLDKVEPWSQVKYACENIPDGWISQWKNIKPLPELRLPEPKISVGSADSDDEELDFPKDYSKIPEKIFQSNSIEIWHSDSTLFHTSMCYLRIEILSPSLSESVES